MIGLIYRRPPPPARTPPHDLQRRPRGAGVPRHRLDADRVAGAVITVSALYWPRVRTVSQRTRVARMRATGMTFGAISKETGIPVSTLHEWCTRAQAKKARAA